MTAIIALIVLVSVGIVTVDGECQPNDEPIKNCCYILLLLLYYYQFYRLGNERLTQKAQAHRDS